MLLIWWTTPNDSLPSESSRIWQFGKIPFVVHTNDLMKRLQILHSYVESQQIKRHYFGKDELLLPTPFVFPEVAELLAKGSMKKSLKKVINKGKKKTEFVSIHTQPSWIWCTLKYLLSYPHEVVNLSIHWNSKFALINLISKLRISL